LSLKNCKIGKEGGIALGNGLKGNKKLKKLDLSENQLEQKAIQSIVDALAETNTTLEWLDLSCNNLDGNSALPIPYMVERNQCLSFLSIRNNLL